MHLDLALGLPLPKHPEQFIHFDSLGFENFDVQALSVIAGRMVVAAVLAAILAYRPWRRMLGGVVDPVQSGGQVLVAVAGGLMTAVVGSNTALAFALVGLGGFIRFRYGMRDPRDVGVMFFILGVGMASGVGLMPVAITATLVGLALLLVLDLVDRARGQLRRVEIHLFGAADPAALERQVRPLLAKAGVLRGSRIKRTKPEIVFDLASTQLDGAGAVLELLATAGIAFEGDVTCDELPP